MKDRRKCGARNDTCMSSGLNITQRQSRPSVTTHSDLVPERMLNPTEIKTEDIQFAWNEEQGKAADIKIEVFDEYGEQSEEIAKVEDLDEEELKIEIKEEHLCWREGNEAKRPKHDHVTHEVHKIGAPTPSIPEKSNKLHNILGSEVDDLDCDSGSNAYTSTHHDESIITVTGAEALAVVPDKKEHAQVCVPVPPDTTFPKPHEPSTLPGSAINGPEGLGKIPASKSASNTRQPVLKRKFDGILQGITQVTDWKGLTKYEWELLKHQEEMELLQAKIALIRKKTVLIEKKIALKKALIWSQVDYIEKKHNSGKQGISFQ